MNDQTQKLPPVAALLSKPGAWTKKANARNKQGLMVPYDCDTACSFCVYGALRKVYGGMSNAGDSAWSRLAKEVLSPIQFNDAPERTQEEVVQLCIKAGV